MRYFNDSEVIELHYNKCMPIFLTAIGVLDRLNIVILRKALAINLVKWR